jgi:hypothetical protein
VSAVPRSRRLGAALLRVAPLGFALLVQATWLRSVLSQGDPMAVARRDWTIFWQTGHHLAAGDLEAIYPRAFDHGYLWLYPPYCIYLTAPLGLLAEPAAYALCFAVELVAVILALAFLRASLPAPRTDHWSAAAIVLASMPFNTTVAMGQISGILTLIVALALHAWVRGRPFAAGLFVALLFVKPQIAAFVALAAILAREWRMVAGTVTGCATLAIASLPLGLARWTEYATTMRHYLDVVRDATPLWKQLTLYAFWRTVPGLDAGAALGLWLASVTLLIVLGAAAIWRTGAGTPDRRARIVALAVLLGLALNVYAYFYDGLLLAVPGIVWWVRRRDYRHVDTVAIAACVAAVFVVGYVRVFLVSSGVSWAGAFIGLWAGVEAYDLLARSTERVGARQAVAAAV